MANGLTTRNLSTLVTAGTKLNSAWGRGTRRAAGRHGTRHDRRRRSAGPARTSSPRQGHPDWRERETYSAWRFVSAAQRPQETLRTPSPPRFPERSANRQAIPVENSRPRWVETSIHFTLYTFPTAAMKSHLRRCSVYVAIPASRDASVM